MSEYKLKLSNGKLYLTWVSDGRIFAKVFSYQDILVDLNEEIENLPKSLSLYQNYPNPFNPTTKIKYSIPANEKRETANVKIIVYDVLGKEIKTLVNENKSPGNYEVNFDASNLANGVYYYQLKSGDFVQTKKMVLLK
ncbi:MAG: T9SS type A sorting domain-containing protein [Ignavibacteriae bacterium]|nr:T9SS type A sorting domain-containing protein [Ignavibacteriota bacterium]